MQITSISINAFGKLKHFTLNPNEGLNVIYGPNEQGKSTLMNFIRMMFYGTSTRKADLLKNPRDRYSPWDGSNMSGSIEFIRNGEKYRLERTFKASNRSDIVKLIKVSTGTAENIPGNKDIGGMFFNMGEESFERSVFIGQAGTLPDISGKGESEIIARLQNLVSSGSEIESYHDVKKNLTKAYESICSKGGKIGTLDKLQKEKIDLEDERTKAFTIEKEKAQILDEYNNLTQEKDELLEEKKNLVNKNNELQDFVQIKQLETIVNLLKEEKKLEEEYFLLRKKLTDGDFEINQSYLEDVTDTILDIKTKTPIIDGLAIEIKSLKEKIGDYEKDLTNLSSENEYKRGEELYEILNGINSKISKEQIELANLKAIEKSFINKKEERNRISSALSEKKRKQEELIKKRDLIKEQKGTPSFGLLILSAILLVSFILLGVIIHPLFFLGVILSAILVLIPFIKGKGKETDHLKQYLNDEINSLDDEISDFDNNLKVSALDKSLEEQERQVLSDIAKANENLDELQIEVKNLKAEQESLYIAMGIKTIEKLKIDYKAFNLLKDKIEMTFESLESKEKALKELVEKKQEQEEKFFEKQKAFFDTASIADAEIKLKELNDIFSRANITKSLLQEKSKEVRNALNGRSFAQIEIDLDVLKSKYLDIDISLQNKYGEENIKDEITKAVKIIDTLNNKISKMDTQITELRVTMEQAYKGKKELSQIDTELLMIEKKILFFQEHSQAIKMAIDILDNSFEQMQKSFGPIVNRKTGEIFSRLTDGKYSDLAVSKELDVIVKDPISDTTVDWRYLSGGTIDQLYFALRLAISEFMSEKNIKLPLFLDDAFLQYDDKRAELASKFIIEYVKKREIQIILFTCQKSTLTHFNEEHIIQI